MDKASARRRATEAVRRRYDRTAGFFDLLEHSRRLRKWRALLWQKAEGTRILEVGVGTGASFRHYPPGSEVTAIDISDKMLSRARARARRTGLNVTLEKMDVQQLRFADNSFDTVVASLVLCSVPDPTLGLSEIKRVCRAGGKVVLLEHVLSRHRIPAFFMGLLNPVARLAGDNINRRTIENVAQSGLVVEKVTHLNDLFKLIEARKV